MLAGKSQCAAKRGTDTSLSERRYVALVFEYGDFKPVSNAGRDPWFKSNGSTTARHVRGERQLFLG